MADLVVAPSAVSAAIAILRPRYTGVKVASKVPKERPDRFIRVSRAGGESSRYIDSPLLIIEFWSVDIVDAEQMALTGQAAMLAAQGGWFGGAFVTGWGSAATAVKSNGIAYFPDPDSDAERFQLTGQLSVQIGA